VEKIKWAENQNDEILALDKVNLRNTAVVNSRFEDQISNDFVYDPDFTITLKSQQPNELVYDYQADSAQFVVFSENYYQPGWQAYIDGKEVAHVQANYVLRAMNVPAGQHQITFKFEPEVIDTGSTITLISSILLGLILLGGLGYEYKRRK
jgi:uncharacterized membrane protein YfhO